MDAMQFIMQDNECYVVLWHKACPISRAMSASDVQTDRFMEAFFQHRTIRYPELLDAICDGDIGTTIIDNAFSDVLSIYDDVPGFSAMFCNLTNTFHTTIIMYSRNNTYYDVSDRQYPWYEGGEISINQFNENTSLSIRHHRDDIQDKCTIIYIFDAIDDKLIYHVGLDIEFSSREYPYPRRNITHVFSHDNSYHNMDDLIATLADDLRLHSYDLSAVPKHIFGIDYHI